MKRSVLLMVCAIAGIGCFAQNMHIPKITSPQVASMDSYGEFDVDLFIGSPNITIPIHNVSIGRINMPITLSYNQASVQPNVHPSWVGLGWNLNCGGVISRKIKDMPDEYVSSSSNQYGYIEKGVYDAESESFRYYDLSSNLYRDLQADEFTFSFGGYKGRFFYTSNGWQALDVDEDIKVELLSYYVLKGPENIKKLRTRLGHPEAETLGDVVIYGFVVTTADGTKYTFGGSLYAIEFGNSFSANYDMYYAPKKICADAWYLTEIRDIDGNMVLFAYDAGEPVCQVAASLFNIEGVSTTTTSSIGYIEGTDSRYSHKPFDPYNKEGRLIFPVYLRDLSSGYYDSRFHDLDYVNFSRSITQSKGYSVDYLSKKELWGPDNDLASCWIGNANRFKWYQLDAIAVSSQTKYNSRIYRLMHSPEEGLQKDHRLALYSIIKLGGHAWEGFSPLDITNWDYYEHLGRYDFSYNDLDIGYMGQLSADRWGYCRANPRNGLLRKIVYPTGGYSEFEWEGHDCSMYVAPDKNSLNMVPGILFDTFNPFQQLEVIGGVSLSDFGYDGNRQSFEPVEPGTSNTLFLGGSRIKSIKSYARDQTLLKSLSYKYKTSNNRSSGILNGNLTEVYKSTISSFGSDPRWGSEREITVHLESFNGLTKYSYNGRSHVGYSRVVEQDELKGIRKEYEFTNYGDVFDQMPLGYANGAHVDKIFSETVPPYQQLGTLKSITEYGGAYVKEKIFRHQMIETGLPGLLRLSDGFDCTTGYYLFNPSGTPIPIATTFVSISFFYERSNRYKLFMEEEKTYHPLSDDVIFSKKTEYQYNDQGLMTEKKTTIGQDEQITTSYIYPCSNTDLAVHAEMKEKHIYSPWFFTTTARKKGTEQKIIDATYQEFDASINFKPKAIYSLNKRDLTMLGLSNFQIVKENGVGIRYNMGTNLIKDADLGFDKNGRLYKYKPLNGAVEYYVWNDYLKNFPIAKIVAENEVEYDPDYTTEAVVPDNEQRIFLLTAALKAKNIKYILEWYNVSQLEGITGIVKPNGQALKYKFDKAGRLIETLNQDGNTLNQFEYGITNF